MSTRTSEHECPVRRGGQNGHFPSRKLRVRNKNL